MSRFVTLTVGVLALAAPATAQTEDALRSYFEGHRVMVRIDMPGTQEGVDIHADARRPMEMDEYRSNLRNYGAAIHAGDAATVTLVKVKKDLIEFQLDGGGFGTFGDDTSTTVYLPLVEKSDREKELERHIKDEDDRDKRRRMEKELDELRERRERENRRIVAEKERLEAEKASRVAERRLHGGSRFNIRYDDRVPPGVRPSDVMAALAEYVDFGTPSTRPTMLPPPAPLPVPLPPPSGDASQLRKGMTRGEVESIFGRPVESSQRRSGDLAVTTVVFETANQRISVDFVEDLLVRYTISSK
ncbi:MAG TPA: hypothetical protein VFA27_12500 [Vicinamibacterales bacterium]|nr:hypothetical protein [Vicinamibacterales bacterium]